MEPKKRSLIPILAAGLIGAAGSIAMFHGPVPSVVRSGVAGTAGPAAPEPVCDREIRRSCAQRLTRSLLESEPICEAPRYFPLKERMSALIAKLKREGKVSSVSVYTRDFHNGGWIVIGDSAAYTPGRLMSLPCVMAALSVSEYEPGYLQRLVDYKGPSSSADAPLEGSKPGPACTINELIRRTILETDVNARLALEKAIPKELLDQLLIDLELPSLEPSAIKVREYSRVMRCLMNSGNLSPTDSDKAIELLASTGMEIGLPAGVPRDVTVAHLASNAGSDGAYEFHDAGIIFGPQGPYILTIMSKGSDAEALPGIISELSRMVYEEMKGAYSSTGV